MAARRAKTAPAAVTKTRPRPQLDRDTIMEAALRLSGDGSTEPLTVRRLGQELGADPTAIYRHFRDKDALVKAVLDKLVADTVAKVDPDAGWRERMTQLAHHSLRILNEHPGIGSTAGWQTTGGPGELAAIEMIIVAMNDAGLNREDVVRFYAVLSSYLISFGSAQASSRLLDDRDLDAPRVGVTPQVHNTNHPAIADVRDELEALHDRDIYDAGVQVILDAVEARAAQSSKN
jgi:AcrR family transcriptional regulator